MLPSLYYISNLLSTVLLHAFPVTTTQHVRGRGMTCNLSRQCAVASLLLCRPCFCSFEVFPISAA